MVRSTARAWHDVFTNSSCGVTIKMIILHLMEVLRLKPCVALHPISRVSLG